MKKLLLVIDYINDITHREGKIAAPANYIEQHGVFTAVNAAIAKFRQQQEIIVQVKVGFSPDYIECPPHSPLFAKNAELGSLQLGSWGTEFHDALDVQASDAVIIKHRVSALYGTPLMAILRANAIDTVVVAGVSTNMAVETVVRELHDRDFNVVVLADACAAASVEAHEASLRTLARLARVCTVAEFNA